jgi:hypothetical protein
LNNGSKKLKFPKRKKKRKKIPMPKRESLRKCKKNNLILKRQKNKNTVPSNTTAIHSILSIIKILKVSSPLNLPWSTRTDLFYRPTKRKMS